MNENTNDGGTAQRAHANFTENLTPFLGALLIAGTKYPVYAAALGGLWAFARVLFAVGYTSSGPKGRIVYVFFFLFPTRCPRNCLLILILCDRGSALGSLSDFTLKLMAGYASLGYALGW
jgi:glutathione S-transferase